MSELFRYLAVTYIDNLRKKPESERDQAKGGAPKIGPAGFGEILRRNYAPVRLESMSGGKAESGEAKRRKAWKLCGVL